MQRMELTGERLIPASVDTTWAALNDPETLKGCIAGCESLERIGDDALRRRRGDEDRPGQRALQGQPEDDQRRRADRLHDQLRRPGRRRRLRQGLGRRRARPRSRRRRRGSRYTARATVGGKMAQIGSRLIDATAAKIAEDFFRAFEAHAAGPVRRPGRRRPPAPLAAASRVARAGRARSAGRWRRGRRRRHAPTCVLR